MAEELRFSGPGCRGLDPIGDTERQDNSQAIHATICVAEGSIRLGILKGTKETNIQTG